MTRFARILTTVAASAVAFTATPSLAATTTASASTQLVKPLVLKVNQTLDFGTVLIASVVAGTTYTVSLAANGTLTCTAGLSCPATGRPAIFNVQGSNNQVVRITTTASTLTSGTGTSAPTLALTPIAQATVTMTSSGFPGNDFNVGASFPITSTTADGLYTGNISVTVDYQ